MMKQKRGARVEDDSAGGRLASNAAVRRSAVARVAGVWSVLGALVACSSGSSSSPAPVVETEPEPGGAGGSAGERQGVDGLVDDSESPFAPVGESEACAVARAETVQFKEPVDIIVVIDNSASMGEELAATERNINENFASILEQSQLDYRMILVTQHRYFPRTGFGDSATMLCVAAPLSGLSDCISEPEPQFSEHFFHYSTHVESDDSFDILLDTYEPPFGPDREDEYENAPLGWSEWLRPGIKKVFLELSDDNEDMSSSEFIRSLTELAPEHFGADPQRPNFIFHSIVGVAEKAPPTEPYQADEAVQSEPCSSNGDTVSTAGETYQELSRLTGGLRFPICLSSLYEVVFREIAGKVIAQSDIACEFPLPESPAGRTLDLDRVSISIAHDATGAEPSTFGQVREPSECQSDAFFIEDGRVELCPEACSGVRGEEGARVDVLFGCESSIIVR